MSVSSENGTPIKLKFVTEIRDGTRKENIAFETKGVYFRKNEATYLTFEEERPKEAGRVKTVVKISDGGVLILRSGAVKMRQSYIKKETTYGLYQSEMGQLEMETYTNNLTYDWLHKTKKGKLYLTYQLKMQGQEAGRYTITILFKEEQK
ncbi:DUF1934 domain-containing protein [Bacillus timonensis]|nr:DUF1934 domain-containing protein [Bacillus timonensis]